VLINRNVWLKRFTALRLAASQQDLDVNGDECKRSTAANPPPSGLIIQAFYDYAHSAESKRPTPINCLVHHLYRACPRVSDLSLAASRPALVPGKLMPRKVTPQRGISFSYRWIVLVSLLGDRKNFHTCARYQCFAAVVAQ